MLRIITLTVLNLAFPLLLFSYSFAYEFSKKEFPDFGLSILAPDNWKEEMESYPRESFNDRKLTYEFHGSLMSLYLRDIPTKHELLALVNLSKHNSNNVIDYLKHLENQYGLLINNYQIITVSNQVMLLYTYTYQVEHYGVLLLRYGCSLEGSINGRFITLTFLGRFADTEEKAHECYEALRHDLIKKVLWSVTFYYPSKR
ncbi:hypothetical protein [Desulfocurvibacter africanus]|uniref:Uncharacterized protein n=1 Tax=Desulfocurvibacter africanus subsp. africanus str. Walvis Bay TaxID=690850 RepID=F3Z198_DESAF|nr:hypothetical protein [Desulfocurvibacter africanus]EGJ51101.1 hypothetical protein Desaf_2788 [Desulfocurvibacter africanus subsp. africanus str. Walvis Bay]